MQFSVNDMRQVPVSAITAKAARATGTLTIAPAVPTADDTFTIGATVFTWKASASSATEVTIGGTVTTSAENAVAKVNAHPTAGALVTASNVAGVVTFTAILYGTAGNSIALAESGTNTAVSGATLTGGVAPLVAEPGAGKRIVACSWLVSLDAAGELSWYHGDTALMGAMEVLADSPVGMSAPSGALHCAENMPLSLLATTAANGYLVYTIVRA